MSNLLSLKEPSGPSRPAKAAPSLPQINPDACGIDVGATQVYVSVAPDRDEQPVRCFDTFTSDLMELADWLVACQVKTVAMESTGVYWIPLYQILEDRGFEVMLVNAHHLKNVPGRKSDVDDCQWIQYLHAVGLLRGSFRPSQDICALRSLARHRDGLVQEAAQQIQKMQKALTQMNLQIHHVLSDISGKSGLAILEAILAGQRAPKVLAGLRDSRVKAPEERIIKALVGDYRPEHLFTLEQSLLIYKHYQQMIRSCDARIEQILNPMDANRPPNLPPASKKRLSKKAAHNQVTLPNTDLTEQMQRLLGTDLTKVPGLEATTVYRLYTELGPSLSAFPTAGHFVSWLGLSPNNRVSGGKVLSAKTRNVNNRVSTMLRVSAQTLHRSKSYLGEYYRRMRTRLGAPKAITAAAHKLARIIYYLIVHQTQYDESVFTSIEKTYQQRRAKWLAKQATALGYQLTPITN
jgi:transposase